MLVCPSASVKVYDSLVAKTITPLDNMSEIHSRADSILFKKRAPANAGALLIFGVCLFTHINHAQVKTVYIGDSVPL